MQVVIETLGEAAHLAVQLFLAGVREGRMADVVTERKRFRQIFIQRQRRGHRAGDLRNFDGVRQAVAEVVGDAGGEDLHLVFQTPEGTGVNDPVAVALEFVAVRVRELGITPAPASVHREAQTAERNHFWDMSESALMVTRLTLPRGLLRNGSSS